MKNKILPLLGFLALTACNKLDLNPLSYGSSETWYSTASEIDMSLNGLYKGAFWATDNDDWTDDWMYRDALTAVTGATINSETDFVNSTWTNSYKAISRANTILAGIDKAAATIPDATLKKFKAEAKFVRASQYSKLISHYGDVVYYTGVLSLEESFALTQSPKATILKAIYDDFDFAAANLPVSYGANELKRATKGAALALKARIALYMGDYAVARDAAKACMDMNIYSLNTDFSNLFISKTKNSVETIFGLPRSIVLKVTFGDCQNFVSRNAGGWGAKCPSWDLFCSFLCTDGLPIDKSPLFNPRTPFKNRDPRCSATIVEFQTQHLGFMYQPHPDSLKVLQVSSNAKVDNKDTRSVAQYAS